MSNFVKDLLLEAKRLEGWDNSEDVKGLLSVIKDGKILEVGCGTGKIIEELSKNLQNSFFVGIEIVDYFLEVAIKKNIRTAIFIKANALDDIFPEQTFDRVLFRDSLHIIRDKLGEKGVKKSLRNAYSYLKDRGLVVIRDSLSAPSKKIKVTFESKGAREIFSIFARRFKRIPFEKSESVELEVEDLVSFFGNFERIRMNPKIKQSRRTFRYSIEEYNQLLQDLGFKMFKTKSYKFSKKLIPKGVSSDYDKLPETYCMLVYERKQTHDS